MCVFPFLPFSIPLIHLSHCRLRSNYAEHERTSFSLYQVTHIYYHKPLEFRQPRSQGFSLEGGRGGKALGTKLQFRYDFTYTCINYLSLYMHGSFTDALMVFF